MPIFNPLFRTERARSEYLQLRSMPIEDRVPAGERAVEERQTQPNVSIDSSSSDFDYVKSSSLNAPVSVFLANLPLRFSNKNSKFAIILGWIAMIATAYKCDHLQTDKVAFDPYEILGIDSVG